MLMLSHYTNNGMLDQMSYQTHFLIKKEEHKESRMM